MITIGLDLGDQVSRYCLLDAAGTVQRAGSVRTTREALTRMFRSLPSARVIVEVGTHSPWVSRGLTEAGHEVIVANARRVRLITAATRKSDPGRGLRLLLRPSRSSVSCAAPAPEPQHAPRVRMEAGQERVRRGRHVGLDNNSLLMEAASAC
jgi:transposase